MFKEIKAKFDVVGITEKGKKYRYYFVIERKRSGAFTYGDRSCHLLRLFAHDDIGETNQIAEYYYDTRYDHISTYKPAWVKTWRNFIKRHWLNVQSIDLIEYVENDVDEEEERGN